MISPEFKTEYFEWMYDLMIFSEPYELSYRNLFVRLYQFPFSWSMERDANRNQDGLDLPYIFAEDNGYDTHLVKQPQQIDEQCSILEMMVALSLRMEDDIMRNNIYGDRTAHWFWEMLSALGISNMSDDIYSQSTVDDALMRFVTRSYDKDGRGGLFLTSDPSIDMRCTEIWYQMHVHLNEVLNDEEKTNGYY